MIIHSVTIDNVKSIEHLELTALPERGVFLISGENERGKSTIMDALHAFFNIEHGSAAKALTSLQPLGRDVGPRVSVRLTAGETRLTMTKQWVKGKSAELKIETPRRATFTGKEAEDRFSEILDQGVDKALWEALFLRQDDLSPTLDAAGIPAVERALRESDEASGDVADDSAIVAAVRKEREQYVTPKTGRPRKGGELANAKDLLDRAERRRTEAEEKRRRLADAVTETDRLKRERARAEADLPKAKEALARADQRAERAAEIRRRVEDTKQEFSRVAENLERAEKDLAERGQLSRELEDRKRTKIAAAEAYAEAARVAAEAQKQKEKARARRDEAVAAAQRAEDEEAAARRAQRLVEAAARRAETARRVESVERLEAELAAALAARPPQRVTPKQVNAVETAELELKTCRARRDALTAKMRLSGAGLVEVNGREIVLADAETVVSLTDGTVLRIGEVTATYAAATGDDGEATAEKAVAEAEAEVGRLLNGIGVPDLEAARAARDATAESDDRVRQARARRDDALPAGGLEALREELAALDAELSGQEIPDLSAAEAARAVREAEGRRQEAAERRRETEEQLELLRAGKLDAALAEAQARAESATEEYDRAAARRAAAEEELPESKLVAARDEARAAVEGARARRAAAEEELREAEPEEARRAQQEAQARVEAIVSRIERARDGLLVASGRIEEARGAEEECESAEAAVELAKRRHASVERRASAATRLLTILMQHRQAARDRYAEPFGKELEKLAAPVFGDDVGFELGDQLEITARTRGAETVALDQLSGGAKEQLMLLTRFAIARLAGERVPVFVDDALGSTDTTRLGLMGGLFAHVGEKTQVFVLTCMPERYDTVTGKRDYPMDEIAPR